MLLAKPKSRSKITSKRVNALFRSNQELSRLAVIEAKLSHLTCLEYSLYLTVGGLDKSLLIEPMVSCLHNRDASALLFRRCRNLCKSTSRYCRASTCSSTTLSLSTQWTFELTKALVVIVLEVAALLQQLNCHTLSWLLSLRALLDGTRPLTPIVLTEIVRASQFKLRIAS